MNNEDLQPIEETLAWLKGSNAVLAEAITLLLPRGDLLLLGQLEAAVHALRESWLVLPVSEASLQAAHDGAERTMQRFRSAMLSEPLQAGRSRGQDPTS